MIESILHEAHRITHADRNEQYGHPLDNHSLTAELWTAYLSALTQQGKRIGPEEVCIMNVLQKISRSVTTMKRDTLVDICGFTHNIEMVQDERKRRHGEPRTTATIPDWPGYHNHSMRKP